MSHHHAYCVTSSYILLMVCLSWLIFDIGARVCENCEECSHCLPSILNIHAPCHFAYSHTIFEQVFKSFHGASRPCLDPLWFSLSLIPPHPPPPSSLSHRGSLLKTHTTHSRMFFSSIPFHSPLSSLPPPSIPFMPQPRPWDVPSSARNTHVYVRM